LTDGIPEAAMLMRSGVEGAAASAVMRALYRSVVVKRELSQKAKLSIYRSVYIPTLTYGHELWVVTERMRCRIQAAEMSFLRRVDKRMRMDGWREGHDKTQGILSTLFPF